jgi:hypothetical protein
MIGTILGIIFLAIVARELVHYARKLESWHRSRKSVTTDDLKIVIERIEALENNLKTHRHATRRSSTKEDAA